MEKVLVIGGSGLVGKAICEEIKEDYTVYGTYNSNKTFIKNVEMIEFNMEKNNVILNIIERINPNKIIVSLTGDKEKQLITIKQIVDFIKNKDINLIFISTWNVFDRYTIKAYEENDIRSSISTYGQFKIQVEDYILDNIKENSIILRLPMVWGKESLRLNSIVKLLEKKQEVEIADNMVINTISDKLLAKQIKYIIDNYNEGIFHLGSNDEISHSKFTKEIIKNLGYSNVKFKNLDCGEGNFKCVLKISSCIAKKFQINNEDVLKDLFNLKLEC